MTIFEDRKNASEAKYRLDQEARFKIGARRNKLLGLWAAARMGLSSPFAEDYAMEVVAADFERPHRGDVALAAHINERRHFVRTRRSVARHVNVPW